MSAAPFVSSSSSARFIPGRLLRYWGRARAHASAAPAALAAEEPSLWRPLATPGALDLVKKLLAATRVSLKPTEKAPLSALCLAGLAAQLSGRSDDAVRNR